MVFNPCRNQVFMPTFTMEVNDLEVVEETKLLRLTVRSDMRWTFNTHDMVKKAR